MTDLLVWFDHNFDVFVTGVAVGVIGWELLTQVETAIKQRGL